MKNKNTRIKLRKESIRQLQANQLGNIIGGCVTTTDPTQDTGKTVFVCPP